MCSVLSFGRRLGPMCTAWPERRTCCEHVHLTTSMGICMLALSVSEVLIGGAGPVRRHGGRFAAAETVRNAKFENAYHQLRMSILLQDKEALKAEAEQLLSRR
jgi:hypothetical protein